MTLGRMSGLGRLLGCPGHASIPQDHSLRSANAKHAAAFGTALHSLKEGLPREKADPYNLLSEEDVSYQEWLVEHYQGWNQEKCVGYNVAKREAYAWPTEQEMQASLLVGHGMTLTGHVDATKAYFMGTKLRVHVEDLKTSVRPVELEEPQLLGYGLAVVVWEMQEYVKKELGLIPEEVSLYLSVLHWPREGEWRAKYKAEHGRPFYYYGRDVSEDELILFREKLEVIAPLVSKKVIEPGPHCLFCERATFCPAQQPSWPANRLTVFKPGD